MDIPFESFVKLIYHLGNPPKSSQSGTKPSKALSPTKIFQSWLNHQPKPFPQGSGKHLFRLLFPHEGSRRRYGLRENKLALELERLLGLRGLSKWDKVCWDNGESGTGCLGREIEILMRDRSICEPKSSISLREIDSLFDELASSSTFSQLSQQPITSRSRSPQEILSILYRESNLTPYGISVLTQIILRDLRPLLTPLPKLPIRNPTTMLRMKSNTGPEQLSLREALCTWDKRVWGFYNGGMGNLDRCFDKLDMLDEGDGKLVVAGPVVGINVKIPKCRKGRSISDALSEFTENGNAPPAEEIWAETKYDGYRMQIHVDCLDGELKIKVFSKSTRDSTEDRLNTHSIILASLNLPIPPHLPIHPSLLKRLSILPEVQRRKGVTSIILEAEVVPYNESSREGGRCPGIEEFWWLGNAGVTASAMPFDKIHHTSFGQKQDRHLCLIFFDILYLDGQSLLHRRYEDRRALLEQVIRPIQGFAQLAERTRIPLGINRQFALRALEEAFQRSNERREEGLVLKASNSTYANMKWQWVKLKKDYIPNLGDCIDLVLLGAGWDIDRARELRVDTSVFTTFYLGVCTNPTRISSHKELPHFEVLFRVSYGPDRTQLEYYNECLRHGRWGSKPFDKDDPFKRVRLSWTYTLQKGMIPPSVMFERPLCAEVMGAGFQKLPGSDYYELRWPRLQKIFEPSERQWVDALSSQDFIRSAHQSLGYHIPSINSPYSPPSGEDSIRALWRSHSTINLIDVPRLVSPSSPRSPRRVKSEPNLTFLMRDTMPSPGLGGRAIEIGRKLMAVMSGREDLLEVDEPLIPSFLRPPTTSLQPVNHLAEQEKSVQVNRPEAQDEISKPTTPPPKNTISFGPPLVLATPRKSPSIKPTPHISPVKRLISSIDWSSIDIHDRSIPAKKHKIGMNREGGEKARRKVGGGMRALSLRSRLKLAARRVKVAS
uniref:ATP-dependent DNA ligase family profile domain-containing protein n=1 Tax=Kwoniella bestiolae CBS 10118 TaxID=1296100 RepID=A0A1B9FU89_9TREE|nr:hypothetical protein I302_07990 [Kwoniella bestiolae CBS 10118]OCF22343.1 hypothetical protein I302_07990 [Kwoniella bestiolae CBS 10118]